MGGKKEGQERQKQWQAAASKPKTKSLCFTVPNQVPIDEVAKAIFQRRLQTLDEEQLRTQRAIQAKLHTNKSKGPRTTEHADACHDAMDLFGCLH